MEGIKLESEFRLTRSNYAATSFTGADYHRRRDRCSNFYTSCLVLIRRRGPACNLENGADRDDSPFAPRNVVQLGVARMGEGSPELSQRAL